VSVLIENRPPNANAGPDQTVTKKTQVTLDGTGSSDSDGDSLTYAWMQTGGSVVALLGANTPTPTFTPPTSGIYTFQLTVDDGNGGVAADTVEVTATNTPPVAEAGPDQTARKNTLVALDGSRSSDSDGDILTFTWAQISGPAVTLTDAGTDTPTFTPARVGTYAFRLTIDDGDGGTSEDAVSVTVWGLPPIASLVARPPSAEVGAQIEFDASGSADPDGTIVDFAFLFSDDASMSGSTAVRNHSYAAPGSYVVTLTVTDDDGNVSTASVTVEITSIPPSAEANYKPLVAVIFAIILLLAGVWSSRKKPWKGGKDGMAVAKTFMISSMPFILAEAVTGVVSLLTGILSIPPIIGFGTAIDLVVLVAGLVMGAHGILKSPGAR
jgi:PKD repeat protein